MSHDFVVLPMLRSLLLLLAFFLALVPPGICECRLAAMVLPCADHCDHDDADDDQHPDESCDCDQLKPDCVLSSPGTASSMAAIAQLINLIDKTALLPSLHAGFADTSPGQFLSFQPLYLTLRALRI